MEKSTENVAPSRRRSKHFALAFSSAAYLVPTLAALIAVGSLPAGCGAGTAGTPDPIPSPSLVPTPTPSASASPAPTPSPLAADPALAAFEQDAFNAINQARAQRGLPTLGNAEALVQAARRQSQYNAVNSIAPPTHMDGSGQGVAGRVTAQGYTYVRVGEALLYVERAPNPGTFAITQWAESPEHSGLLFDPALREVGVAMWQNGERVYITAVAAER